MKKYTTVIFDLDGTLLNTLDDLAASVNYGLKECGYPLRTREEVRNFIGNGVEKLIERSVPSNTPKDRITECLDFFSSHYKENMNNQTRPYDGILSLLEELKVRSIKVAVVSNKVDSAVKALCENEFKGLIQVAIGARKEVAKKPAPDMVFAALRLLNSKDKETLYVGDSDVDMETAKNAKLDCVGVTWGFRERGLLESKGANYIIQDPKELYDIL